MRSTDSFVLSCDQNGCTGRITRTAWWILASTQTAQCCPACGRGMSRGVAALAQELKRHGYAERCDQPALRSA